MRTRDDTGSGPVRYSFYSPEMNLIAETEPSTSATQTAAYEYVWFDGAPVAQIDYLHVRPEFSRRGVGHALVEAVVPGRVESSGIVKVEY